MKWRLLDYEPTRGRSWRKARRLVALAVVGGALCAGFRWGGVAWHRACVTYAWHQSETLDLPPEMVVYEESWDEAARLLRSRDYHAKRHLLFNPPWYPKPPPGFVPPACFLPSCFRMLEVAMPEGAVAFLHARTTANGTRRLVCVAVGLGSIGADHEPFFDGMPIALSATGFPVITHHFPSFEDGRHIRLVGNQHLRVYAGQADSNNASHFTFRYSVDGAEGVIDGWLRDPTARAHDAYRRGQTEWVEFSIRDGPASAASDEERRN